MTRREDREDREECESLDVGKACLPTKAGPKENTVVTALLEGTRQRQAINPISPEISGALDENGVVVEEIGKLNLKKETYILVVVIDGNRVTKRFVVE